MFKSTDRVILFAGITIMVSCISNCQIKTIEAKYGCKELKAQDSKEFILPDTEAK